MLNLNLLPKREGTLGVALGARELGLAVVQSGKLVWHGVHDVRPDRASVQDHGRLEQALRWVQRRHPVARCIVVRPSGRLRDRAAPSLEVTEQFAKGRDLVLAVTDADAVRRAVCPLGVRASNYGLVTALARALPELKGVAPAPVELGSGKRKAANGRDRYWFRAFLAIGAAIIRERPDLTNNPYEHEESP